MRPTSDPARGGDAWRSAGCEGSDGGGSRRAEWPRSTERAIRSSRRSGRRSGRHDWGWPHRRASRPPPWRHRRERASCACADYTALRRDVPAMWNPDCVTGVRAGMRPASMFVLLAAAAIVVGWPDAGATGRQQGRWIAFHADPGSSGDLYVDGEDGSRRRLTRLFGQVPTAAWSPDGTRLAMLARPEGIQDVYVIGADGHGLHRLTHGEGDHFGDVSWAPDGRRLAFTCCGMDHEAIYLIRPDGTGRTKLADNAAQPVWSPDGRRIAFLSKSDGNAQVYVTDGDGSNQRRVVRDRWSDQRPGWSPDGRRILFTSFRNRDPNLLGIGNAEILVASADGSGVRNVTRSRFWEGEPAWSPDGKQIAFAIRRDFGPRGVFRVGVMNADGSGKRLLPPVPDPATPTGLANSCCPSWHPGHA